LSYGTDAPSYHRQPGLDNTVGRPVSQ